MKAQFTKTNGWYVDKGLVFILGASPFLNVIVRTINDVYELSHSPVEVRNTIG